MKNHLLAQLIEADLKKARELMTQGRSQEALVVVLSALQQALGGLKESLFTLQLHLKEARENLDRELTSQEEPESGESVAKEPTSRYYH